MDPTPAAAIATTGQDNKYRRRRRKRRINLTSNENDVTRNDSTNTNNAQKVGAYENDAASSTKLSKGMAVPADADGAASQFCSIPQLLHLRQVGLQTVMGKHRLLQYSENDAASRRRHGNIPLGTHEDWWRSVALCQNPDSRSSIPISRWKPRFRRNIAFRDLDTPPTDAVLALSRDASYSIALGGSDGNRFGLSSRSRGESGNLPILALRFFGVPSVAALKERKALSSRQRSTCSASTSPLFLTIPLLLESAESSENRNLTAPSALLGETVSGAAAANTPVRMLTSCDGVVGVCFVLHSTSATEVSPALPQAELVGSPAIQDEDALGTVFIFPLPGIGGDVSFVRSFKCSNVRVIGNLRSHTIRNLLWPTRCIPYPYKSSDESMTAKWCDGCRFLSSTERGYLMLNDEDDGFRMTWIRLGENDESSRCFRESPHFYAANATNHQFPVPTSRSDIIAPPEISVWDRVCSERFTGSVSSNFTPLNAECDTSSELCIAFEAFFCIEALLSDIMARRKKMFACCSSLPDYFYNLISMSDDGCSLELVLVFAFGNRKGKEDLKSKRNTPAAIGVFLIFNIFDMSYSEKEWVQHPTRSDSRYMRQWANELALNWRMREQKVGPYSIPANYTKKALLQNCVKCADFHEDETGRYETEDFDSSIWISRNEDNSVSAPKRIAMSSLYPFCDVVTNKAVCDAEPVSQIVSKAAPISLTYQ